MSLDNIRSRIRQLRKMTVANGCTEAEAAQAAEKAMKLMDKYGFNAADLEVDQAQADTFGKRRQVVDVLWPVVARVCRCFGYLQRGERLQFVYHGAPGDVAIAEYLHDVLLGAFKRECAAFRTHPEYTCRCKAKTRNAAMKGFQQAMVNRLARRLQGLWWARLAENGNPEAEHQIETQHVARLGEALSRHHNFTTTKRLQLPDRRFDGARVAGYRAGGRVQIELGVGSQSSTPALLG